MVRENPRPTRVHPGGMVRENPRLTQVRPHGMVRENPGVAKVAFQRPPKTLAAKKVYIFCRGLKGSEELER